ncbi:hypothetical protein [Echinicola sp. 20G]|uniref:hypothetical protein n=1 Tax=Echinicola sp. 20G TaxID=2781961 RepID=UPI0019103299|nr:hypothetical protein [Echinicola sp. 20G]
MKFTVFILFLLCYSPFAIGQELADNKEIIFSAIKGNSSKEKIIYIDQENVKSTELDFEISGEDASYFQVDSILPSKLIVSFRPDSSFVGIAHARFKVGNRGGDAKYYQLRGLSTKALEGENEPPLAEVLKTLGLGTDIGWSSLANHIEPDLEGEELAVNKFKKAKPGVVEMIPVARYSPAFTLPFGYYFLDNIEPQLQEVGILEGDDKYPEHQTLFPGLKEGGMTFDPGEQTFGFYTTSPSHIAYSEDAWNKKFYPNHAEHACRVYPVRTSNGRILPDQYLICFEEATNGDYQDYVFWVKNVAPLKE